MSTNIISLPPIRKLTKILRYLAAEQHAAGSGDELLFQILHFDFYRIPKAELVKLMVEFNKRSHTVDGISLRNFLKDKCKRQAFLLFDVDLHPALAGAGNQIEKLAAIDFYQDPEVVLENCIRESGMLADIMQLSERDFVLETLKAFSDSVKQQKLIIPGSGLAVLLETVNRMTRVQASITLPETQPVRMKPPEVAKGEVDVIGRLLKKFVMNVTALSSYLKCPIEFYFRNLLRVPSRRSEAMEFGSAVHFALQMLFEKMQSHPSGAFPAKAELLQDFRKYLRRHRATFTFEAYEKRLVYGDEMLGNYYDRYIGSWRKIVAVERNISKIVFKGVPLKGKPDKLEFLGRDVNIVDYKTGDPGKSMQRLKGPHDEQPYGGDYWRQAVFYTILIDNYTGKKWKGVSTEFDFIEADRNNTFHKFKIIIQPQDIETVTHQIVDSWEKIQRRDFYRGCGREDCHWCGIVR